MKQKGVITQTPKKIKLNNNLLDYWNMQTNKNQMVNKAIAMYRKWQLEVEIPRIVKEHKSKTV